VTGRLEELATDRLQTLLAGLGEPETSPRAVQSLAVIDGLIEGELDRGDDAGTTTLVSYRDGVMLRVVDGRLSSVVFEVQQNPQFAAFVRIGELLAGLRAPIDLAEARELLGEPPVSEYHNDKYLLGEVMVWFTYRPDRSLQRVGLVIPDPAERRRLAKAAVTAPSSSRRTTVEIADEDGILALVDPATFRHHVPDWDFDLLTARFAEEGAAQHGLVWMTGMHGYGQWRVEFRTRPSRRSAFRDARGTVEVTDGRLQLVTYGELTAAAEEPTSVLTTESGRDHRLPNGLYGVRLRQLFDPGSTDPAEDEAVFEVVLTPARRRSVTASPFWWEPAGAHG